MNTQRKKRTFEDLEEVLDNRRPEEEGVGVTDEGRQSVGERTVDDNAAPSDNRPAS